jgi:hypothetical protein
MADGDRRHTQPDALLRFLERDDQSAAYVQQTAEWIKTEYPGSAAALLPRLRDIYRRKAQTMRESRG